MERTREDWGYVATVLAAAYCQHPTGTSDTIDKTLCLVPTAASALLGPCLCCISNRRSVAGLEVSIQALSQSSVCLLTAS